MEISLFRTSSTTRSEWEPLHYLRIIWVSFPALKSNSRVRGVCHWCTMRTQREVSWSLWIQTAPKSRSSLRTLWLLSQTPSSANKAISTARISSSIARIWALWATRTLVWCLQRMFSPEFRVREGPLLHLNCFSVEAPSRWSTGKRLQASLHMDRPWHANRMSLSEPLPLSR